MYTVRVSITHLQVVSSLIFNYSYFWHIIRWGRVGDRRVKEKLRKEIHGLNRDKERVRCVKEHT
jgi:hypothetical protein